MKQLFVFASALLVSTFAMAAYPIEGTWGTTQSANGFTFEMTLKIENNSVTGTNVCKYQGHTAQSSATAPATYDATTFSVTGSAKNEQSSNGLNCSTNLEPMTLKYEVQGSTITFTKEGSSEKMILTRR